MERIRHVFFWVVLALPSCAGLQDWDFSSGAARAEEEEPDADEPSRVDAGGDATKSDGETVDGGPAPLVLVQSTSHAVDGQQPTTTFDVALPLAQTAGDTIVIAIGWYTANAKVTSVADSNGNSYAPVSATVGRGGPNPIHQLIEFATGIKAGAANTKIVVTWDSAPDSPDLRVVEFSGIDPKSPLEGNVPATGESRDIDSGALTTTSSRALLFSASTVMSEIVGGDPTYQPNVVITSQTNLFQWKVVPPGTYTATARQADDPDLEWVTQLAAFR